MTETVVDTRSFGERLIAAGTEVAYLEKRGYNAHFRYSFLAEADVKRAVGEALRKHGLMISAVAYSPIGECSGKAATICCRVEVSDARSDETVSSSGIGAGADSSDKAPMKAMAAALKYALTSLFLIATGDDPEEDGGKKDEAPAKKPAAKKDEPATESGPSPVVEMLAKIAACEALTDLNKLKIAVSKLRDDPGFDALAEAFKARGKALTTASKEAA